MQSEFYPRLFKMQYTTIVFNLKKNISFHDYEPREIVNTVEIANIQNN